MKITIRILETNSATTVDKTIDNLDVSKVTAVVPGSPTTDEVLVAITGLLFNGGTFPTGK